VSEIRNFVTPLHQSTKREYLARMVDDKVHCMLKAKEYEQDYWDGDRRFGYGGYKYLPVLDVGCGKGFLLYEMQLIEPGLELVGFDISAHGLAGALPELKASLFRYRAQDPYPFGDNYFDLVISLTTLHNLRLFELKTALAEIERVGKHGYIMLESYRNEEEQFNLQCWALTCESFFDAAEWIWLYRHFGYTGDYEFIYFE
jgi:ubiquinone/menaquinone biosynthesis C-methylase UbiE